MNKFTVVITDKVKEFIKPLDLARKTRINRVGGLFEEYGPLLPGKYLKKLSKEVWELRLGDVRLFLAVRGNKGIVVHGIIKKSDKTPIRDLELAKKRVSELKYED